MTRPLARLLAVYASLSAVYLLYLPHAVPVLDDWTIIQLFSQARSGGPGHALRYLQLLVDNTWWGQFRLFWASFVPVYALAAVADFAGWPYFLLCWTAHLLTAVLLGRTVSLLSSDQRVGLVCGAVYAVFPPANQVLFWPLPNYYLSALALAWWFYLTWRKLAVQQDFRYRWTDAALLVVVLFTGEQILAALVLLLPLSYWLFGDRSQWRRAGQFWLIHAATMMALAGAYTLWINRVPVVASGFQSRYGAGSGWTLYPAAQRLLASLGLNPALAEWRPEWRLDAALAALIGLALAAFLWGLRGLEPSMNRRAAAKLLAWSSAAAVLAFLPVAPLPGIEWRYLYVPSLFLVPAGVALLWLLGRRWGTTLAGLTLLYGLALTYHEMRQCWMPQSRVARAMLQAARGAGKIHDREAVIFARAPHNLGPAPSFLAGASWSLKGMLAHVTRAAGVEGARELLVNERGEMALYRPDSLLPFRREDFARLRVFERQPDGRFAPRSLVALPAAGDRFELVPLATFSNETAPPGHNLTREEMEKLPIFGQVYFAHRMKGPLVENENFTSPHSDSQR